MIFEQIRRALIAYPDVEECTPLLPDVPVYKVRGRMLAYGCAITDPPRISIRMPSEHALERQAVHDAVVPSYGGADLGWITISLDGTISVEVILDWLDEAYEEFQRNEMTRRGRRMTGTPRSGG